MKTKTENISTQLIMLAVALGIFSCGEAQADDRRSQQLPVTAGNGFAANIFPAQWPVDRQFVRTKAPGDALRVQVTYARWDGRNYVAYMLVQWGYFGQTPGYIPAGGYSNWDGSVTVDDGTIYVVETLSFDGPMQVTGPPQLTPQQQRRAADFRQQLQGDLANAERVRNSKRLEARQQIRDRARLARELQQIEQRYANRTAQARQEYNSRMARLMENARGNRRVIPGDRLLRTGDSDEVKWQAGVAGGVDGLLFKLVLSEDDSEVTVRAGGQKIEFDISTLPHRPAPVQRSRVQYSRGTYGPPVYVAPPRRYVAPARPIQTSAISRGRSLRPGHHYIRPRRGVQPQRTGPARAAVTRRSVIRRTQPARSARPAARPAARRGQAGPSRPRGR